MVSNSTINAEINNYTEEDVNERYIAALIVIADFHEITVDEAHIGITDMLEEIELEVNKHNEPSKTRH
jgi:thymidine phosphorylase|tara:strand:- start:243 stop:446 length:204 start_codon:yes stop_codon:yes gene_type:complete